jgi:hypothetical protein
MNCAVSEAGGATPHRSDDACVDRANGELPECRSTDGGGLQYMPSLLEYETDCFVLGPSLR